MADRTAGSGARVLTINTGSSSLKAGLYEPGRDERLLLSAQAERIGQTGARLQVIDAGGKSLLERQGELHDHETALETLLSWLRDRGPEGEFQAVGHRVVHGGSRFIKPQPITAELVEALQGLVAIDPDHLPQAIAAIRVVERLCAGILQVACFDTAFHRQMPRVAQIYPLPRRFFDQGVLRYGFHGLSYEYVLQALRAADPAAPDGRVVIAHLGNGASMVALRRGASIDTTMGFTPTGGLVMGTRSGDLDPGVLLYLLKEEHLTAAELSDLVNRRAGLLGVSESSADMRDLQQKEATDPRAAEAVDLFCYQARKFVGALAATLGGLDTLVFTAGIGEYAPAVRARICAGLGFLGVQIDAGRNAANAAVISADTSAVTVRVMHTDENLIIARHSYEVMHPA